MSSNIDVSACTHCGECTRNCLFLEKYGMDLADYAQHPELAYHCFLCGVCDAVCSVDISGVAIALDFRNTAVDQEGGKVPGNYCSSTVWEKSPYKFSNYRHAKSPSKAVVFTGCNFPSFFPKTTDYLVKLLKEHVIGVVYDCCSKPVSELGLKEEAERNVAEINRKLNEAGVEEVIMVCPNCFYFLQGKLDARIISIYDKLTELGLGERVSAESFPMYLPCPDRKSRFVLSGVKQFLDGEIREPYDCVQCCGLGGCAARNETDLLLEMQRRARESGEEELYTYCATCIGAFARNDVKGAKHVLPLILGTNEDAVTGRTTLLNRAKCKYK